MYVYHVCTFCTCTVHTIFIFVAFNHLLGKVYDGIVEAMPHFVNLRGSENAENEDIIIDVAVADQYILCVTEDGRVYSWGKNTASTIQVKF